MNSHRLDALKEFLEYLSFKKKLSTKKMNTNLKAKANQTIGIAFPHLKACLNRAMSSRSLYVINTSH